MAFKALQVGNINGFLMERVREHAAGVRVRNDQAWRGTQRFNDRPKAHVVVRTQLQPNVT
jgi:hypothetical protein